MTGYTNKGYRTYYLGTPDNIISSDKIRLYYNRSNPISLDNLLEMHYSEYSDDLSGCNKNEFIEGIDDSETGGKCFTINTKNRNIIFDTIVFYSADTNLPIGYTLFNFVQTSVIGDGWVSEIQIKAKFTINELTDPKEMILNLYVLNSLAPLYSSDVLEDQFGLISEEDSGYCSVGKIKSYFEENAVAGENYLRFTNFLGDLISDDSYSLITDGNLISHYSDDILQVHSFFLNCGKDINEYNANFNRISVGICNGQIALYCWSDLNPKQFVYKVVSLTETNRFDLPRILIPPTVVTREEIDAEGYNFFYFASHYAVLKNFDSDTIKFLDLSPNTSGKTRVIDFKGDLSAFIDPWDITETSYHYNKDVSTLEEYFTADPDLYREFCALAIEKNTTESLTFLRKIGPWFIFTGHQNNEYKPIVCISKNGKMYFDPSEDVYPINDRCILSQSRLKSGAVQEFIFHFVENGMTVESTAYLKAKEILEDKSVDYKISFAPDYDKTNESLKELNIKRRLIIDGLRKRPISSYSLPKNGFITVFRGVLFYYKVEDSETNRVIKIYYL